MINIIKYATVMIALSGLGLAESSRAFDAPCHPQPSSKLPQYIIGYGSLIQTASKKITDLKAGKNLPVMVYGYKRGWFEKGTSIGFSATFLGVIEDTIQKFNGIIFNVDTTQSIAQYDERETGYCRVAVAAENIKSLSHHTLPKAEFWIYLTPTKVTPSRRYPITQSYVDVFLSGCIEVEQQYQLKNFSDACIDTTANWSSFWVNDRIYPRRPFVYQPKARQIDTLLARKLPVLFERMTIVDKGTMDR